MQVQHTVSLLHATPLYLASHGARTCWDSHDKSDTTKYYKCPECNSPRIQDYTDKELDEGYLPYCLDCGATHDGITFSTSDTCGLKDAELVDRVGNKFKHASILEHLRICVSIDNQIIAQAFKENKYSDVTFVDNVYVISTNVRAMQAIDIPMNIKLLMLPEEYKYLFQ